MNDKFRELFDKLVSEISKNSGNDSNLSAILDEVIRYLNRVMNKSFKINHVTREELEKIGQNAFMYAIDDVINYSTEMIRNIQNQIKTTKTVNYNPDYNDITFAMFLIDTISHELCHCNQYLDAINGIITEQTYLNSLCYALNYYNKIKYLDKSYEGDAYGHGVSMMRRLCNEETLKNEKYIKTYQKQMTDWNFFKKNLIFHEAIYYLDKIPFMRTKRGFDDIIIYANHNLSLLSKKEIDALMRRYPLICIGLEEENGKCRKKTPDELMEQYFGSYVKYGKNKSFINQLEKTVLNDIYTYLLMGQLTPEIYSYLCVRYGKTQMDSFMISLQETVGKKITLYSIAYQTSLVRIQQIRLTDQTILQDIDEKYAENKYSTAMLYLKEYSRRINKYMSQQQPIKQK